MANSYDVRRRAVRALGAMVEHLLKEDTECSGGAASQATYAAAKELYPVRQHDRTNFLNEVQQEVYDRVKKELSQDQLDIINELTDGKYV